MSVALAADRISLCERMIESSLGQVSLFLIGKDNNELSCYTNYPQTPSTNIFLIHNVVVTCICRTIILIVEAVELMWAYMENYIQLSEKASRSEHSIRLQGQLLYLVMDTFVMSAVPSSFQMSSAILLKCV